MFSLAKSEGRTGPNEDREQRTLMDQHQRGRTTSFLPMLAVGTVLLWASFPPLQIGILAWIAPLPWLLLITRRETFDRKSYRPIFIFGFLFWMASLHWLRLPHPATCIGWVVLSAYLSLYFPAFVWISRVGVQQLAIPLAVVAPIVWTGLELARAHLLTGFLMASLAHTQIDAVWLLQLSDLLGGYGVSWLVLFVASCFLAALLAAFAGEPNAGRPGSTADRAKRYVIAVHLVALTLVLLAANGYGRWRLAQWEELRTSGPRIALIQGNSLADWKQDAGRQQQIMNDYIRLSREAVAEAQSFSQRLDLIVWPETMFRQPLVTVEPGYSPPGEMFRPSLDAVLQAAPTTSACWLTSGMRGCWSALIAKSSVRARGRIPTCDSTILR